MERLAALPSNLHKQSFILKHIASLPWKSIIIFLFVIFLPIAVGSQIQISSLSSARINLSQRTFGITFLSPSILLLIPLLILFVKQVKNLTTLKIRSFEIFLLLFLIITEISAVLGINVQASAIWLLKLIYGLTIYLIFSRLSLNKTQIRIIIYAFVFVIFMESFLSIMQYIKGGLLGLPIESISRYESANQNVLNPIQETYFFRAIGTFSGSNILTSFLALLIPVITALLFSKNRKNAYLFYTTFVLCLITAFLSFSRWSTVTVFFAIIFTIFLIKKYKKIKSFSYFSLTKTNKIAILVLIFVVMVIFSSQYIQNRFLNFSLNDKSLSVRMDLIAQAIYTIKDNALFGVGGGNFVTFFINHDYTVNDVSQRFLADVHSFYLLLTSETGIAGLLAFLLAMLMTIKFFFQKIKYLNQEKRLIATGFLGSFFTFFFSGLWVMRTFEDRVSFLFWLILGLLVNVLSRKSYQ